MFIFIRVNTVIKSHGIPKDSGTVIGFLPFGSDQNPVDNFYIYARVSVKILGHIYTLQIMQLIQNAAHVELHNNSLETYGWHHGHNIHVLYSL